MGKIRLDALLVKNGQVQSRERAKALIMAGQVYVKNQKCDKAGQMVDEDTTVAEIRGETLKYVSRGGLKLEKAMQEFPITLEGKTTMDIGASTGGFTDCMLQNGAVKVFAVDVGYGQFAWKLRQDERVVNMERTNIRYVTPEDIGEEIDFASVDVSFISLKLVLPVAKTLLADNGEIVALIKPQFEAGREQVGKKGVVKDIKVHYEVIKKILDFARSIDLHVAGLSFSPIKGPEGNIEYLAYLKKAESELNDIKLSDERTNELKEELKNITKELKEKGNVLTQRRENAAKVLEENIEKSLHELNMEKSKFKVNIENDGTFYDNGMDKVEFLISTNPGEPLKPLVKIASGGELSRVMLAIKSILADSDGVDTMIFDEIDTGVSGKAAMSIAKKLAVIAKNKQVICITHLPQLTAMADNHYLIQKNTDGELASTTLKELDEEGRELELARIIDGGEVTELALSHAKQMLENAKNN